MADRSPSAPTRGPRPAESSRPRLARFAARPATSGLILVCTVVFTLGWIASGVRGEQPGLALVHGIWATDDAPLLELMGGLAGVRVWLDQQWWRVISAGFLHGSWLHLVLNMLGLWTVGQWTEKVWGPGRQLALFFLASVGGCLASLAWAEAPLVVGASAGIFGIAGALVVARAWGREDIQRDLEPVSAKTLGFWLVFWLVLGAVLPLVFGISLLAQAGHLGGLVIGCLTGAALAWPKERGLGRGLWWASVGLGLSGLVAAGADPSWRPNYHVFMGSELLERHDYADAAQHFDIALEASPDDPVLANAVAYSLAEAGVELERAETLVRRALEDDEDSADYLDTLGWILCRQGQVEEGRTVLESAQANTARSIPEIQEHLQGCVLASGE